MRLNRITWSAITICSMCWAAGCDFVDSDAGLASLDDGSVAAEEASSVEPLTPMDVEREVAPKPAVAIDEPEEVVYEPSVVLGAAQEATCLVKLGDAFPDLTLPDPAGQSTSLRSLLGKTLTIVVFWSHDDFYGQEQIGRLHEEAIEPYRDQGVAVIAVHVGEAAEGLADVEALATEEASLSLLLDADKAGFAQIAKEQLPRTYLLDADGNILWLDLEYSRSTRRELRNATLYYLQQQ